MTKKMTSEESALRKEWLETFRLFAAAPSLVLLNKLAMIWEKQSPRWGEPITCHPHLNSVYCTYCPFDAKVVGEYGDTCDWANEIICKKSLAEFHVKVIQYLALMKR